MNGEQNPEREAAPADGLGGSVPPPAESTASPPLVREPATGDGPRFAYATDTLLIEIARLNRVIRRLEETPPATATAKLERAQVVTQLMHRVVQLLDAMDVLGEAQAQEKQGSHRDTEAQRTSLTR